MTDATYGALAESVRRLIDATIRTEVGADTVAAVTAKLDAATAQLRAALMPGSFGQRCGDDGQPVASGNVVIGVRNPVAPPLTMHHEPDGSVWTEFILGAAYEGPVGHVHGGVCAMILDHVLGATAHQPGRPAATGTLTLRYERGTPLNRPLRAEARVDRTDGRKVLAIGQLGDVGGATVRAEGVFILPRPQ
ncbi:MAG: PaaI family thioesterase [Mycobacterium sp.]|nr:PaaI family thioesterase [Mycobacterium sp.]